MRPAKHLGETRSRGIFNKSILNISVFCVKTVKIRWRLGALPPDPLDLRQLGATKYRPLPLKSADAHTSD